MVYYNWDTYFEKGVGWVQMKLIQEIQFVDMHMHITIHEHDL